MPANFDAAKNSFSEDIQKVFRLNKKVLTNQREMRLEKGMIDKIKHDLELLNQEQNLGKINHSKISKLT